MNRIIIISESYQRAEFYMRENFPDRNPRGRGVYIITMPDHAYKLRGLILDEEDVVVVESYPQDPQRAIYFALKMMAKVRPLETKTT